MTSKKHLPDEQIQRIYDAAVRAGLSSSRSALLSGIDPGFVLGVPTAPSPGAQLLNDLAELNRTAALTDGTTPLFDWLSTAISLAGPRYEADVFRAALASMKSSPGARPPRLPADPAPPPAPRGFAAGRPKCF